MAIKTARTAKKVEIVTYTILISTHCFILRGHKLKRLRTTDVQVTWLVMDYVGKPGTTSDTSLMKA